MVRVLTRTVAFDPTKVPPGKTGMAPKPRKGQLQYKGDIYDWISPKYMENFKELTQMVSRGEADQGDIKRYIETCLNSGLLQKVKTKQNNNRTKANPFDGKGNSYGRHVEDGWGQYVQPRADSDPYADLYDDWNN